MLIFNIRLSVVCRKALPFFLPVENIVVLVRTLACAQNSLFSPLARSLHPPPAAVAPRARAGFAVASDLSISANEKSTAFAVLQTTDKGFRTKVLSPLSYFTEKRKYGIIKVQEIARRNAYVYGKKREAK